MSLHTYVVQYIHEHGNGWAIMSCPSPSYIEGALRSQSRFRDAKVTSFKEIEYFGNETSLLCEGAVTTYNKSPYDIAVWNGFEGTEQEWLDSLKGQDAQINGMPIITIEAGNNIDIEQDGNRLIINAIGGGSGGQGEENVIETIKVNNVILPVEDKSVNVNVPTKVTDLSNDANYISVEQDPTVPSWAKADTKPTYTAREVGALPSDTVIPVVPDISNDITTDATSTNKTASPKAVKDYVDAHSGEGGSGEENIIESISVNGTIQTITNKNVNITIPTISTDIVVDKTSTTKTVSPSAVYNEVHPSIETSLPLSGGLLPNKLYKITGLTGSTTISLETPTDNNIENEYKLIFTTSSTAPTITWPLGITWIGNSIDNSLPKVEASSHYEVSIIDNYGIFNKF